MKSLNVINCFLNFIFRKTIEPSPPALPALPHVTITEPDEGPSKLTVLGDFDQGATDDFRDASSDEDNGNEEEKGDKARRKSVVTFNDNIERIEIETV
jgi:hypothetical protein